jgi:LmbE family N-acetylglucosaminyl deacetylase/glycosyltransferase involved in cell wall biosynthesis
MNPELANTPQQPRISAIIPARDEAGRIGVVLAILTQVNLLNEIVVVDDGSSDLTSSEVRQAAISDARIKLIQHSTNRGKGQAIFSGRAATQAEIILLLDADLSGLTPEKVLELINPVINGQADMTVGLFRDGKWWTDIPHIMTPWLTGQRCLITQMIDELPLEAAQGYGFETVLTISARHNKHRTKRVYLRGVSHPVNEVHRGLLTGFKNRLKMYRQIIRAWQLTRKSSFSVKNRWYIRYRFILLFFALAFLFSFIYNISAARSGVAISQIPVIDLTNTHRILVIAPHPDDETLGSGGLIQNALSQGDEIRVVVVTNGDGQVVGPLALNYHPISSPADFIKIGLDRQKESFNATLILGLPAKDVIFLSYPDSGINSLWFDDWLKNCPYKSHHTQATSSPYPLTFDPGAQYCGKNLLNDLLKIINDFKPDFINIPHPNDEHPDHRAISNFTRLAISLAASQEPAYHPQVWGYLVHYGQFPQPRGENMTATLFPPKSLFNTGSDWERLPLSVAQETQKAAAVKAYRTQEKLLRSFLASFIRTDELFLGIPLLELTPLAFTDMSINEEGVLATPSLQEPSKESTRRALIAAADLVGWQTLRLGDTLWFIAKTRGQMVTGFNYLIYIKTPGGQTLTINCNSSDHRISKNAFYEKISLSELGNPQVLGFSAEVQERLTLDRTAWHFVILR